MDTRLPQDRQECPVGGTIGLADTSYAPWVIVRELDDTYTLRLASDASERTISGFASIGAALDFLDAERSASVTTPAPAGDASGE